MEVQDCINYHKRVEIIKAVEKKKVEGLRMARTSLNSSWEEAHYPILAG
jgi:hypothetical protein